MENLKVLQTTAGYEVYENEEDFTLVETHEIALHLSDSDDPRCKFQLERCTSEDDEGSFYEFDLLEDEFRKLILMEITGIDETY